MIIKARLGEGGRHIHTDSKGGPLLVWSLQGHTQE
jgi:hypothetical protein